jgi:ABC-type multidrug transport system fused ATPase/permease subunit
MRKPIFFLLLLAVLLVLLPLVGALFIERPFSHYLEFPPLTIYVEHVGFSWPAFLLLALLLAGACGPFVLRLLSAGTRQYMPQPPARPFPWWGYGSIALVVICWVLAWNRFSWFAPLQAYTFFPLWLGYIFFINSLTYRRTGRCLLVSEPRLFFLLFAASMFFWWFFEYLNRFVQNWYYLGVETFSPGEYIIHASICFSTVLPAVLSTEEYLSSFTRLTEPLKDFLQLRLPNPVRVAWSMLIVAALGLAGIGRWPDYLFPLLWISPLLIITSAQRISGRQTIFAAIEKGDWRPIWLPAMAALVCGFFWEMWNYNSLAHWRYSVPYVQRFHLFEMPILGYAGYLPFGLECLVVANLLRGFTEKTVSS